jgi:anti-sigma factor ChrR (cupin superfamily)
MNPEMLPLYALGALDLDEAKLVEDAVAKDPALRAELDKYIAIVGREVAPSPSVRDRLFADVDALSKPNRWERFAARVAEIYDVTVDKARMFLSWIDEPSRWENAAVPGVQLIHLPAGPQWAAADCGIVRMPAGFHFPNHGHHGPELTYVLQGKITESSGATLDVGEELELPAGAEHSFVVDEASGDYIFCVRFYGIYGIKLEQ